ncbi:MAG: IS1595 family transposase [Acidobacteria bacterium]|nr:IS1595 family transposase [Acidobacteriota bacterium]
MNLITIFHRYPDQRACIEHLERVRWKGEPFCPHCACIDVAPKCDGHRVGRWNCHACKSSFNVLSGTIFEKTKVPLQKWFLAIGLMVNAKKSLSSYQLARDLDLTQPTALYLQHRIRAAMNVDHALLQGIVEADETYVGGKPRKRNRRDDDTPAPRGRGTRKTPVIGVVERGGQVRAEVAHDLTGTGIVRFLKKHVDPEGTLLISDDYKGYSPVRKVMNHAVINHQVSYAEGMIHTNTIEGFWSLLKRAWMGSHHKYSVKMMPLFVAEQEWKWNHRGEDVDSFGDFLEGCFA